MLYVKTYRDPHQQNYLLQRKTQVSTSYQENGKKKGRGEVFKLHKDLTIKIFLPLK